MPETSTVDSCETKLMFQFKCRMLPRYFDTLFALNSEVHNYNTRSSKLFHMPNCRTNIRKFALRYQGPKFYNSLSTDIQSAINLIHIYWQVKNISFRLDRKSVV